MPVPGGVSRTAGDTYVSGTNVPLNLGSDRAVVRAANASPNGPSVNELVSPAMQIVDSASNMSGCAGSCW